MPGRVYQGTVADLPREVKFEGLYERTGLVMDHANMCFVWMKPYPEGSSMNMHSHTCDMFIYVIEGKLKFATETQGEKILDGGDFVYVPGTVRHGGYATGDQPCRILEIFAPIRTDYLYVAEHQLSDTEAPRNLDGSRVDLRTIEQIRKDRGGLVIGDSKS